MDCDCVLWMDHAYNGKCDDVLNTEECFWDNGDCCKFPRFLGDCENCTCHEDPFKALFGQLFFGEMDRKMEKESTELAMAETGGCDSAVMGTMCCKMGMFCPPPKQPPTCMDNCEHSLYSQCISCDECPTSSTTTTTEDPNGCPVCDHSTCWSPDDSSTQDPLGAFGGLGGGAGNDIDDCQCGDDTTTSADPLGAFGGLGGLLGGGGVEQLQIHVD